MDDREYTLVEHLADLRTRLARALGGVLVGAIGAFAAAEKLLEYLRAPMQEILVSVHGPTARFMVTSATEYLICQMKVAVVAGVFLASPWVLYQVWQFVAPGLYEHERRYARLFVWAGSFFFCAGGVFCYFAVFPVMFEVLVKSLPADIAILPSLDEHFSFTLKVLLAFGVIFETPVVIVVLSLAGIIDPNKLSQYRRYVVVVAFVVAAILTPPDVFTQVMLAVPLIVLYEGGVAVARLIVNLGGRPLSRKDADAAKAAAAETSTPEAPPK